MKASFESVESIGLPACVANEHGRIVSWNKRAADFFRVSAESAIGHEWHSVVHTVRTPGCCALCRTRRSLRNGEAAVPVDVTLSIDGYYQNVAIIPIPIGNGTDEPLGFLVLSREPEGTAAQSPASTAAAHARVRHLNDDRIIDELTPRERDILACVVDGHDARGIARQLGITHATARNYVQRILTKLGAHNKAEAVSLALTYNLLAAS